MAVLPAVFPAALRKDRSRAQIAIFVLMITVGGGQLCDGCSSFDAGYPADHEERSHVDLFQNASLPAAVLAAWWRCRFSSSVRTARQPVLLNERVATDDQTRSNRALAIATASR